MRYAIFSDIHSNLEALQVVIEAYKNERIDQYLSLGDIVGYASNPKECIKRIEELAASSIAGNHDWATADLFSIEYFNTEAGRAITWTKRNLDDKSKYFLGNLKLTYKNKDLTLVHGTLENPEDFNYMTDAYIAQKSFNLLENDICFVGHTHEPCSFMQDKSMRIIYSKESAIKIKDDARYIINVGSVGQPRDNDKRAAYCIYDTEKKEVLIKRVDYDIQAARKKIIEAGLPKFLGDRLLSGL